MKGSRYLLQFKILYLGYQGLACHYILCVQKELCCACQAIKKHISIQITIHFLNLPLDSTTKPKPF